MKMTSVANVKMNALWFVCSAEKKIDKIEHARTFVSRLLENGSDGEVLMLKRHIVNQLELLTEDSSKPKYTTNLEFITDLEQFQDAVKVQKARVFDLPDENEQNLSTTMFVRL